MRVAAREASLKLDKKSHVWLQKLCWFWSKTSTGIFSFIFDTCPLKTLTLPFQLEEQVIRALQVKFKVSLCPSRTSFFHQSSRFIRVTLCTCIFPSFPGLPVVEEFYELFWECECGNKRQFDVANSQGRTGNIMQMGHYIETWWQHVFLPLNVSDDRLTWLK